MKQFIKELVCACMITYAMIYATSCTSISQVTAYEVINGK